MHVHYDYRSRLSGALLEQALRDTPGKSINWGYPRGGNINLDGAVKRASNKRVALEVMQEAGVPTPTLYLTSPNTPTGALVDVDTGGYVIPSFPVIGRPDHHKSGSGFYFCRTLKGIARAKRKGATHFIEFIPEAREFRVHIVNGKSIKIAEKIGGGNRKNFKHGAYFAYPDFDHKKSLRRIAKQAVMSLGLDFGAVDILYKDENYFVLEVNSAPSLTSASDTLDRYVRAFKEEYGE